MLTADFLCYDKFMNLSDKTILVTGAGSGIGKELVLALLEKGASVAAVDLHQDSLEELKRSVYDKADNLSIHVCDISDLSSVESLSKEVLGAHKNIDGIINNAGIIQPFVKVSDLDYKAINRVMSVNFYGTLYVAKSFLPFLLKRPEAYIVNVSSMGGFLPVPGQSVYGASKAAVKLLTESLYAELKDTNVRVSIVFPGATDTNISSNSGIKVPNKTGNNLKQKEFPTLSAGEAAKIIIKGIEKNKPYIYTGNDSSFMSFLYRINPIFATNFIAKKMKALLS